MSHIWTRNVTRMNESCHTYEGVESRTAACVYVCVCVCVCQTDICFRIQCIIECTIWRLLRNCQWFWFPSLTLADWCNFSKIHPTVNSHSKFSSALTFENLILTSRIPVNSFSNTLQHTATDSSRHHLTIGTPLLASHCWLCRTLQHTVRQHSNTLQHTATHCNTTL